MDFMVDCVIVLMIIVGLYLLFAAVLEQANKHHNNDNIVNIETTTEDNIILAHDLRTNRFVSQAMDRAELINKLMKIYPGKHIIISNPIQKESA